MSIEVNCPFCDQQLQAKDDMAGRTVNCPNCGGAVTIPEEVIYDAEVDTPADDGAPNLGESNPPKIEGPPTRPCPMCGENIPVAARKCRYCGESFGTKKKKRSDDGEELTLADWLLCIFCANIGCIIGIIRTIQGNSTGPKMIVIAIVTNVIVGIIMILIEVANQG